MTSQLASDPLARVCAPDQVAAAVRVARPHGAVAYYLPGSPPRRLLELDRRGHVTLAIRRGPAGEFAGAWVRTMRGAPVGVRPGGAEHPLWGRSDRIVTEHDEPLTVAAALDWDRIAGIPPLADPTRLPPGAGTAVLNLLAALAADQGARALRYRGPYATEQLFWALAESFRFDAAATDPLGLFLAEAEAAFLAGASREAPLDWAPSPHQGLHQDGVYAQLRDGVEKVHWEGRTYSRADWQGLTRREHRVVRPVSAPDGARRFVAGLVALGRPLEDHLVLDAGGELLEVPAPATPPADTQAEAALAPVWRDGLAGLLALETTPLLAPAIAAVWPGIEVVWGPVWRDLVETRGQRVCLASALAHRYAAERATLDGPARRTLAQTLVRDVLGLVAPPVRRLAAAWLAAQSVPRQSALLESAVAADRPAVVLGAAPATRRLVDALAAGKALPAP